MTLPPAPPRRDETAMRIALASLRYLDKLRPGSPLNFSKRAAALEAQLRSPAHD